MSALSSRPRVSPQQFAIIVLKHRFVRRLKQIEPACGINSPEENCLPNSHEAPWASLEKYLHLLPRDRQILVVCQKGNHSYITAHYLRSKGFGRVSTLLDGLLGWKARHGDLYQRHAGRNVTVLRPEVSGTLGFRAHPIQRQA